MPTQWRSGSGGTADSPWTARATGDMTLAVVAHDGQRILTLDLLRSRAMRASDDARWLAQAYNNLDLLASIPSRLATGARPLCRDPQAGTAPFPWSVTARGDTNIAIIDNAGRLVAERRLPRRWNAQHRAELLRILCEGVACLNADFATPGLPDGDPGAHDWS